MKISTITRALLLLLLLLLSSHKDFTIYTLRVSLPVKNIDKCLKINIMKTKSKQE